MKFKQVLGCLHFFEKDFRERWNLEQYNNVNEPAIFFGICNNDKIINEHKGFKLIILASSVDGSKLFNHINPENVVIKKELISHGPHLIDIPNKFKVKQADFQIKDYSMFRPNTLGDKVYAYIGSDGRNKEFNYDKLKELSKKCEYEFIYGSYTTTNHMIPFNILKENYYDKCFVNLNLSKANTGMTSVFELAYMGRYTISNVPRARGPLPSVINFDDDDDIINKINNEAKKIGTIQPSIENCTVNDEWLYIDFWRN